MSAKQSYYGPFFWLAIVSFVVPLVVAAKAFQEIRPTSMPTPQPDASGVDNAIWDYLLKGYVENGLIDYEGMRRDYMFRTYLRQLASADVSKLPTSEEQLALMCNAYNAFVVNGVVTHKIHDSVMNFAHDGRDFFDVEEHIFNGQTISLNQLEHEIIRKQFQEPRIHVALVCAAKSCPAIRPEAYTGPQLDRQLDDQSRQFANNPAYVVFNQTEQTVTLSPILNWYGDDWSVVGGYLPWLATFAENAQLKSALTQAQKGELNVTFFEYDWSLNSQTPANTASATGRKEAEFGSGSIPNG